ncbi:hypothetical protein JOB18_032971 [Solea senegalensis]|uniref:Uncharacterized protein n=1 Tax=Solea senegalensis TaxID=28829 RepID=A0AAV6RUB7_SOLSE|nr:hypothetical protein JOB18_032971 [Solea senegalensis]
MQLRKKKKKKKENSAHKDGPQLSELEGGHVQNCKQVWRKKKDCDKEEKRSRKEDGKRGGIEPHNETFSTTISSARLSRIPQSFSDRDNEPPSRACQELISEQWGEG